MTMNDGKLVREFQDHTEALMAKDYLQSHGVESDLDGVREYSSIVVGGTQGRYFLRVKPEDYDRAADLLHRSQLALVEKQEPQTETSSVSMRRSVSFAFMAVFLLPWIGNYISIREALKYARQRPRATSTSFFIILISIMQLPGLAMGLFLLQQALDTLGFSAKYDSIQ